jgi:polyferredoxin
MAAALSTPLETALNSSVQYVRRRHPDYSQAIRRAVQIFFVLLNAALCTEFVLFVRQFEARSDVMVMNRPPGVEGWLPIAGMMNTKYLLETGSMPAIHPAAMWLFITFVAISLLLRKAFCSWLCPVGTLSEWLWKSGRATFRRNFAPPKWLDITLRSLKYVLFGLFLYAVGTMPARAIAQFLESPYGLVADVKMLNFFRHMSVTAAAVVGVLALSSIFVKNFWCRYLCPYGAVMGLVSMLSPLRIRRAPAKCIDCAKCAKACPSLLPVDKLVQIRSAECLGCMECVAVCPAEGALQLSLGRRTAVPPWAVAACAALLFFGIVGYARLRGQWDSPIPVEVYKELVPRAQEFAHP